MGNWQNASDAERTKRILILGSSPDAPESHGVITDDNIVVAINNSWRASPRYDFVICPDDFPDNNRPSLSERARKTVTTIHYLDAEEQFGGHFWCGFTTAFSAAYWSMNLYKYSQLSYFACDMIYSGDKTHFYGNGAPDPLRRDITLQNIEGKSLRAFYHAFSRNSLLLNASSQVETRLAVPRVNAKICMTVNLVDYVFWAISPSLCDRIKEKAQYAVSLEQNPPFDLSDPNWSFLSDSSAWDFVAGVDAIWHSINEEIKEIEFIISNYIDKLREINSPGAT